ncbi:pyk [Blepharisma stoltei]|uniref:pyruvate kinase n=1 Tax=Blepharisma stoltei TaxID=1481888 RepID=A0AAU9JJD8_9CILI|nr:unnamed protein product [Blepharisma stoltei]
MPLRKTKIACTLGKASSSKEVIIDLINAGMDIARISDRFLEIDKQTVLNNLRDAMKETGKHVGVMLGLRESDLRLGNFNSSISLKLRKGDFVRIYSSNLLEIKGENIIHCNNKEFPNLVDPGDKLLIDFGKIVFTVESIQNTNKPKFPSSLQISHNGGTSHHVPQVKSFEERSSSTDRPKLYKSDSLNIIRRPRRLTPHIPKSQRKEKIVCCRVDHDCVLSEHKPCHIRPSGSKKPPISCANDIYDFADIRWACDNDIDFIVYKQLRDEEDLHDFHNIPLPNVKKFIGIQNSCAAQNSEALIQACDGVMIGRGMLALETSLADVCTIQKEIVKRCNELSKPVIISTQLLETMVHQKHPSSAEVTDISNAILDGCDALLLTGETAYGDHPVLALQTCEQICLEAEKYLDYNFQCEKILETIQSSITIAENVCYCAVRSVLALKGKIIICQTRSGRTAQQISRFMPPCLILALTNSPKTTRFLKAVRGVYPSMVEDPQKPLIEIAIDKAKEVNLVERGDTVVYVGGTRDTFDTETTAFNIIQIS